MSLQASNIMSRYKTGMIQIEFSDEIREAAPGLRVIQIEATAGNCPTSDGLWQEIEEAGRLIASNYELQQINKRPAIAGTRRAYKALGKDPNRYRPSAEALCRRLVNGKGIYRTTTHRLQHRRLRRRQDRWRQADSASRSD